MDPTLQQPKPTNGVQAESAPSATPAPAAGAVTNPADDPAFLPLLAQSPTLRGDLETFQRDGGTMRWGTAGGGTYIANNNEIVLDANSRGNGSQIAQSLSHELGHYKFSEPQDLSTRETYVNGLLRDEAAATLNNARVRGEIVGAGGPDIGFPGLHSAQYQQISGQRLQGKITEDQALNQIGNVFKTETTSTTGQTYNDYYGASYPGPGRSQSNPQPSAQAQGRQEGVGPQTVGVVDAPGSTPTEQLRSAVLALNLPGVRTSEDAEKVANTLALNTLQNGGRIEDIKTLTANQSVVFGMKAEHQTFSTNLQAAAGQTVQATRDELAQAQVQALPQNSEPSRSRDVDQPVQANQVR